MSVAKRFWEGHLTKDGTEIGYCNGTISVDPGLQTFYELGAYDMVARRNTARELTGTLDHGYIDRTYFASMALATAQNPFTFAIAASFSDRSISLSGCSIESFDLEIPTDGWISETVNFRAKTVKSY